LIGLCAFVTLIKNYVISNYSERSSAPYPSTVEGFFAHAVRTQPAQEYSSRRCARSK